MWFRMAKLFSHGSVVTTAAEMELSPAEQVSNPTLLQKPNLQSHPNPNPHFT